MTEQDEQRKVAWRAAIWTVITLVGFLSAAFIIRGVALNLQDEASHAAAISCLLSAIAAATMFLTRRVESGADYRTGYQEGFADGRRVNSVVPFPQEHHPERVR